MRINTLVIKNLMNTVGIKQKDIANKLNMSAAQFSAALKRGGLSDDRVKRLAIILGVDYAVIVDANEEDEHRKQDIFEEIDFNEVTYLKLLCSQKDKIINMLEEKLQSYGDKNK